MPARHSGCRLLPPKKNVSRRETQIEPYRRRFLRKPFLPVLGQDAF